MENQPPDSLAPTLFLCLGVIIVLVVYFLPFIVALARGHSYKWVIFVLNLIAAWTCLLWIALLVWAIWPKEKALLDPVVGNPTGTGRRNTGDVMGNAKYGRERGYEEEKSRSE